VGRRKKKKRTVWVAAGLPKGDGFRIKIDERKEFFLSRPMKKGGEGTSNLYDNLLRKIRRWLGVP